MVVGVFSRGEKVLHLVTKKRISDANKRLWR